MSTIQWATVRDAIQQWIVIGSGLAGDHVIWSGQRDAAGNPAPRPQGMFIELKLNIIRWNGQSDFRRYTFDQPSNTLTLQTDGPREAILTAKCWQGVPGGNPEPSMSPLALLNDAMAALGRDDVNLILVEGGVGVGDVDGMTTETQVLNKTKLEHVAVVTAKINLASEIVEVFPVGQGWIQHVRGSGSGDLAPVVLSVDGP